MQNTILVTGSSRGIGRACAVALAGSNTNIIVHYKQNREGAKMTQALCEAQGARCQIFQADLRQSDEVGRLFENAEEAFGAVSVLVNNAGISLYGMIQDITDEEWQDAFALNVHGTFYCTRRAVPNMISQKYGRIINISSMWGLVGSACESLYSATKGAINAFTKACAKELIYSGVTVNAIAPGVVDTDMMQQLDERSLKAVYEELPLGSMQAPEEIAFWVKQLALKQSGSMTGQILSPNGGLVY